MPQIPAHEQTERACSAAAPISSWPLDGRELFPDNGAEVPEKHWRGTCVGEEAEGNFLQVGSQVFKKGKA
jgi:hypothetical protein